MSNQAIQFFKKYQISWNLFRYFAPLIPDFVFRQPPQTIIIEPTNVCNLRCPVCPTPFLLKRERGFMSLDMFKAIVDDLAVFRKKPGIAMNFAGEPLLNKNVGAFVAYAQGKGFKTFISTNAVSLTEDLAKELIGSGLDSIHLCLDGFSKQSQESYRIGSDFEQVKKNIENFIKIKKELKADKPRVIIQTLITAYSESEIEAMAKWAEEIGADEIYFKTINLEHSNVPGAKEKYAYLLPNNQKFLRKQSSLRKTVCFLPVRQAVVYWNGDLGICCIDYDSACHLPNISQGGFRKAFFSPKAVKMRKLAMLKKLPICQTCKLGDADFLGESRIFD